MACTSTAEAEVHAVLEMVYTVGSAADVVREIFGGLFGEKLEKPVILNDSQPGLDAIKSKRGRTKHYDIRIKFLAKGVADQVFGISKVNTRDNKADLLTKALRGVRFRMLTDAVTYEGSRANSIVTVSNLRGKY